MNNRNNGPNIDGIPAGFAVVVAGSGMRCRLCRRPSGACRAGWLSVAPSRPGASQAVHRLCSGLAPPQRIGRLRLLRSVRVACCTQITDFGVQQAGRARLSLAPSSYPPPSPRSCAQLQSSVRTRPLPSAIHSFIHSSLRQFRCAGTCLPLLWYIAPPFPAGRCCLSLQLPWPQLARNGKHLEHLDVGSVKQLSSARTQSRAPSCPIADERARSSLARRVRRAAVVPRVRVHVHVCLRECARGRVCACVRVRVCVRARANVRVRVRVRACVRI